MRLRTRKKYVFAIGSLIAVLRKAKDGGLLLGFRLLPRGNGIPALKFFMTAPEARFRSFADTLTVKTVDFGNFRIGNRLFRQDSATVIFNEIHGDDLFLYGKQAASFCCGEYASVFPARKSVASSV